MIDIEKIREMFDKLMNYDFYNEISLKVSKRLMAGDINFTDEEKIFIVASSLAISKKNLTLDMMFVGIGTMLDITEKPMSKELLIYNIVNALDNQALMLLEVAKKIAVCGLGEEDDD